MRKRTHGAHGLWVSTRRVNLMVGDPTQQQHRFWAVQYVFDNVCIITAAAA